MEIVKIENLNFKYPGREKNALSEINLSVGAGELLTVAGKSGCGKTTLLRLLKPKISPNGDLSGNILFFGEDLKSIGNYREASDIGFVMQNPESQIVTDKVWHELAFGLESLGVANEEIRARVSETASFFGIQNWFYRNTSELSGGEKQILNLASVTVMKPELLILDEPTSRLDPIAASNFINAVKKINSELGTTVIMSEHRLEEVFPLSDRVIIMDEGHIEAIDAPGKVGALLKESSHDMYCAMPTPVRVFGSLGYSSSLPLSVKEARSELSEYLTAHEADASAIKKDSDAAEGRIVISAKEVFFRYGKDFPYAVKDMNLDIFEGELFAVLGGNGAGKTTALSLIAGLKKPERGKILIDGKRAGSPSLTGEVGYLPQTPEILFTEKTVGENLLAAADYLPEDERIKAAEDAASLCRLDGIINSHPFDLSGGELSRAGLALVMIRKPRILLLDEPTKGMDAHFKRTFAKILTELKKGGVTIVTVSHDIEFCARHADRVALFFDGAVTSLGRPREFFSKNRFYTTAACRMTYGIIDGAVLEEDILSALGKSEERSDGENDHPNVKIEPLSGEKRKRLTPKRIIFGTVFAICFFLSGFTKDFLTGIFKTKYASLLLSAFFAVLSLSAFFPQKDIGRISVTRKKRKKKSMFFSALFILAAVPLTVISGEYFFDDRKYYFISILIILEAFAAFFAAFEKRKPEAREIVVISVMAAIAVAGRAAFYAFPEFKPVLAVIIVTGIAFGGETGFLTGCMTGFVSNFMFGQGPWTPWQMFGFGIVGFLAGAVFRSEIIPKNRITVAVFGAASALLIYGPILNTASVLMTMSSVTPTALLASMAAGLPMDTVHAFSTAVFLWFLAKPLAEKLERAKIKYGML